MEQMGGLVKRMPQTAMLFALGSAAIAALPPLNGFASEWLVFQGLLAGAQIPRPEIAIAIPVAIGMLALTSGLAAACFVKAFGISFLAMPRSDRAAQATDSPWTMRFPIWLLGIACIALGLGASVVVPGLYRVLEDVDGLALDPGLRVAPGLWIEMPEALGRVSPVLLGALLAAVMIAVMAMTYRVRRRVRVAETWACGRIGQTPRMECTAAAFAEPLRRVFAELYRPTKDLTVSTQPESRYFIQSISYTTEVHPWIETLIFDPVMRLVEIVSTRVRRVQAGSVHLYLLYVVVALLSALASLWWL
jgi:hydrogenase-4 component B